MKSIKRNAFFNVLRQVFSIIIPLITFPYATRILGPENYGIFSFSSSIVSYFILIATLGINEYAAREGARLKGNSEKLLEFCNEVFTINVISSLIAYCALGITIIFVPKINQYYIIVLILSLRIAFNTIGTEWINIVYEDYEYITKRYLICSIISIFLLFTLVHKESDLIPYTFFVISSNLMGSIINYIHVRKDLGVLLKFKVGKKLILHLFPILILFANSIATTIYVNSDITIIGFLKGKNDVGIYSAATKLYTLIKGVINAAIMVIVPRASSCIGHNNKKEFDSLLNKTISSTLLFAIPSMVGLAMLSDEIVTVFLGEGYIEAVNPLRILSIALVFSTVACAYVNGILIPNRDEKFVLLITSISAIFNIVFNFILVPEWTYNATAITTLFSEMLMLILGYIRAKRYFSFTDIKQVFSAVFGTVTVFAICLISKYLLSVYILRIVFSIIISSVIYALFLALQNDNIVAETIKKIKLKHKK